MNKNVIILRAASGAGKSTLASLLAQRVGVVTVSADDFFTKEGVYDFDAEKLGAAHLACQSAFVEALKESTVETVIVSNTNTSPRDFKYYEEQAKKFGAKVFHIVVENRHGSNDVHGVPDEVKSKQKERILSSILL